MTSHLVKFGIKSLLIIFIVCLGTQNLFGGDIGDYDYYNAKCRKDGFRPATEAFNRCVAAKKKAEADAHNSFLGDVPDYPLSDNDLNNMGMDFPVDKCVRDNTCARRTKESMIPIGKKTNLKQSPETSTPKKEPLAPKPVATTPDSGSAHEQTPGEPTEQVEGGMSKTADGLLDCQVITKITIQDCQSRNRAACESGAAGVSDSACKSFGFLATSVCESDPGSAACHKEKRVADCTGGDPNRKMGCEKKYENDLKMCDSLPPGAEGCPETLDEMAGDGGAGPGLGWPNQAEIDQDLKRCESFKNRASLCCKDPVKCVKEDSDFSLGNLNTIGGMLQVGASLATVGGSIKDLCSAQEKTAKIMGIANAAMAATCNFKQNACNTECKGVEQKYKQLAQKCQTVSMQEGTLRNWCYGSSQMAGQYNQVALKAKGKNSSCKSLDNNFAEMSMAAATQAAASMQAKLCKDQASASTSLLGEQKSGPMDCSDPANASNPFCRNCSKPGAENDPVCRQIMASTDGKALMGSAGASAYESPTSQYGNNDSNYDVNDDGSVAKQQAGLGQESYSANKTAGVGPSGGGVPGGGGGSGGAFAGGGGGSRGNGKSRYKTNTLGGLRGGGGYSVSSMGFSSAGGGGSRGYGRGRSGDSDNPRRRFNMKDYLPKKKNRLQKRGLAGLAGGSKDISSASSNIWQKISHRYYSVCRKGRLLDCQKLAPRKVGY